MSLAIPIDLTNSDDEGERSCRRCAHGSAPALGVVDLTDSPEASSRPLLPSGGDARGKRALAFDAGGDGAPSDSGGAAGGSSAASWPAKRLRAAGEGSSSAAEPVSFTRTSQGDGDPERAVSCQVCSVELNADERIFLSCSHWACSACQKRAAIDDGRCFSCKTRISISDMKRFLTEEQINATSEGLLHQLLAANPNFIRCPNASCGNVFERMEPTDGIIRDLPRYATDGQPLTESQARHMQQNRFRCEECGCNFCASCNAIPYHNAATCKQAESQRTAAKCRFCLAQLPRGKKNARSCGAAECDTRMEASCEVKLKCGHACLGVFGESECPPCLECAGQGDEFCNICWTEELRAAPCLGLKCGHYFHEHCLKQRLIKQWPTPKISFTYATCPLCNSWVDHPHLEGMMRNVHTLRSKVEAAALERFRIEGLAKSASPAGRNEDLERRGTASKARGHESGAKRNSKSKRAQAEDDAPGDAMSATQAETAAVQDVDEDTQKAMRRYNFYQCVKCKRPYFGGVAACGAVGEGGMGGGGAGGAGAAQGDGSVEDGRNELMCGSCSAKASGMAAAVCPRHGEQYIEFKCRFCCSIATFFCFGHTHFCEGCHKKVR